jgi:hypothetical protein
MWVSGSIVMTESITDWVQISPAAWSAKSVPVQPGDLRRFAPMGRGRIGVLPADLQEFGEAAGNPELFSLTAHHSQPLLEAPITEPTGGTLYLDGEPNAEDLAATLRLLGVPAAATDYTAFVSHVQEPAEERYLTQVRIVRRVAMVALYDALSEAELQAFPQQKLTVGGLIGKFIETEQQRWGTSLSPQLSKRFGNPGQRFRATLAFGFMIENAFCGVYRIWSRAWLLPQ